MDKATLERFYQKRAKGTQISGIICTKQVQYFFKALGFEGKFNATSGWLIRFKY
jgi:hypothetical protein